jgi:uncharacterized protein YjbI with pentapeptide repeats
VAKLPTVTSDVPRDLRNFLDRLREAFDTVGVDQLITARKLVAAGIAAYNPAGQLAFAGQTDQDLPTPPAPSNVTTNGALANVIISWDDPIYRGHAYAEIWAASATPGNGTPSIGDAILVGMAPGSLFAHNIGAAAKRWYWVRFVNFNGVTGAYNAVSGTEGETGDDPAYLLDLLTGEITNSQLATTLSDRIDLVDGPSSLTGSVNERLSVLQAEINELLDLPEYDPAETYEIGESVIYDGAVYQAILQTTGNLPTNTTYWKKLGDFATFGDALAAAFEDISVLTGDLNAETSARTALASQLRGNYTGNDLTALTSGLLFQERTTRANADSALSSSITTLTSTVNGNTSAIQAEALTRANADTALASDITTLTSTVGGNTTAIQNEAITRANADGDLFAQYTVKTDVNGFVSGYGLASTTVNGVPVSDFQIRADRFSITNPSITLVTVSALTRSSTTATLTTATAHGLIVGDTFTLRGVTNDTNWNGAYTVLTQPSTTQITFTVASTLTTPATGTMRVGKTAIPFIVDGGVVYMANAMIKDATITGAKIANATIDTAQIANAAIVEAKISDLAVTNAKIANAAITNAKIANAAINAAKIEDAQITNAKIADAAVTTAKIGDAQITTAKIGDGQITNAKIDNVIQSSTYLAGSAGWKIDKAGQMEMNNATFRGTIDVKSATSGARLEIRNNVIKVFDASGVLRVRIGDLTA